MGSVYTSCDIRSLPVVDGGADEVLLDNVLEHFLPEDAYEVLWEVHRVLIEGGSLTVRVPNFKYWIDSFDRYEQDYLNSVDMMYALLCHTRGGSMMPHKSLWWEWNLCHFLQRIGFVELEVLDSEAQLMIIAKRGFKRSTDNFVFSERGV